MSERDVVLDLLQEAGALAGIRWAHRSAYDQVWQDFNPEGGHDQGWIGYTAHKYLLNRQDRVFQCERYAIDPGEEDVGRDVLAAGIAGRDFDTMPRLAPGTVTRLDLNHSPGWLVGEWRWLMASCEYGQVNKIRWPQKSPTKGEIARQPYMDQDDGLFNFVDLGLLPPVEHLADPERLLRNTLVLAHGMDPETGDVQLYLGRARWNLDQGNAWEWKQDLLALPPRRGQGSRPEPVDPSLPSSDQVADASVRIRRQADDSEQRASGEA